MLGVPDVDFSRPCEVVVLDLCYVGCLQFECVPMHVSVSQASVLDTYILPTFKTRTYNDHHYCIDVYGIALYYGKVYQGQQMR